KNQLRDIETNRANLAHGRLPSTWFVSTQPPYGTLMPQSGRRPQHQSRPTRSKSHDHVCPLRLSKRTICTPSQQVRLVPTTDLSRCSMTHAYSITSSARTSSGGGTVRPSALEVLRLITSSNRVACSTGTSIGSAHLRILSTT